MKNPIERIDPNLFSSILRWVLGLAFAVVGWLEHSWITVGFGSLMFITGFFRPRRCTEEGCDIDLGSQNTARIKTKKGIEKAE